MVARPWYSSYFKIYFDADILAWRLGEDSLSLQLLEAQKRLPAFFFSDQYFSEDQFASIQGLLTFHPLMLVARFAKESKSNDFLVTDVASSYQVPIHQLHPALLFLSQKRYIDYDPVIGTIHVRDKAFLSAFAALGYWDYDHLFFASRVDSGLNASLNFKKKELLVLGVERR